jgi:hypothetical protein
VNVKQFFVTALSQALYLGIATCDDVVRHVTPDVLAHHLPRPLWSRLLTACLGAPRVDAQLVVETVGVPNLCEHIPQTIIWGVLLEIGARALGNAPLAQPRAVPLANPLGVAPPPPEIAAAPVAPQAHTPSGPSIPPPQLGNLLAELEADDRPTPTPPASPSGRSRTPTGQRFRQSNTGIGRLAQNNARRPMASASAPTPTTPTPAAQIVEAGTEKLRGTALPSIVRRGQTETEYDLETEIDWKNREPIAVDDEQLVDWSAAEETQTTNSTDDYSSRKR